MEMSLPQLKSDNDKKDGIGLGMCLDFLHESRWLIATITTVAILLSTIYLFIAKPVYMADILIQVESQPASPQSLLGDAPNGLNLKSTTTAPAEMEILRSRLVVSRAVENARLYIEARPNYLPVIGAWLARRNSGLSGPGLFDHGGYVWGREQIDVSEFKVPPEMERVVFTLTAEEGDRFKLTQRERNIDLSGHVGTVLKVGTDHGEIELMVARLIAKPGAEFLLRNIGQVETTERLQKELRISEKGKPNSQSGIIGVSLEGSDPKATSRALNQLGQEYVRQNLERKSEEAEKSLAFLNRQLPDLKRKLENMEAAYNTARNSRRTVDLSEEAKKVLEESLGMQTKLVELRQRREALLIRFQSEHPAVQAVDRQIEQLSRERRNIDRKIEQLPRDEQDVFRLSRDIKVNTELYTGLLSTSQQMQLIAESRIGNVRLLDQAVLPHIPIKPEPRKILMLAAAVGLMLSVGIALIKKTLRSGIDHPSVIERLGLRVSATIPHSDNQQRLDAQLERGAKTPLILTHLTPDDRAVEGLRNFRASLDFLMVGSRNKVIMMTGPTQSVGKSFVSMNLVAVLASFGKKVLLIDADLRAGRIHRYFGIERQHGLSDILAAAADFDSVIHKNVIEHVDFLSTGELPSKPAEFLARENFERLIQSVSELYDFVVIDTTPVLVGADALIVGSQAGVIFSVVRGGVSTVGEIAESVKRFNEAGQSVTGTVFNDLKPRPAAYGLKYGKYAYDAKAG